MSTPRKAARKTMREAFPAATALRENLELMMIRNHDSRNKLAEVLGVDVATLRRRLEDPTKFTLGDLEALAARVREVLESCDETDPMTAGKAE